MRISMKRMTIAVLVLFITGSSMADTSWSSDENWHGPGWYVTLSSLMAVTLEKGPFSTEDECTRALPDEAERDRILDEIGFVFDCENLQ